MPLPGITFRSVLLALNAAIALGLAAFAINQGVLLAVFLWHRRPRRRAATQACPPKVPPSDGGAGNADLPILPTVTIQVPLYNERYVAQRIIAAVCALDYPCELLHIQVLDDSTDETTGIAQRGVEAARANGLSVELIHRTRRDGYKAGALANGLGRTQSEFVGVFDADFVPAEDFLYRIFGSRAAAGARPFDQPEIGFVQTRWGFMNRDENALTRAQALLLDMHFGVDQPARGDAGLLMNFNGSAGVWRRDCIEDAGGWQADTLTEDLDLSYRVQLRGWRGVYLADYLSPSELPLGIASYKRQQARWARGSVQCLRKLGPRVLRAQMPFYKRLAGIIHLGGYVTNPLLLLLALSTPVLMASARTELTASGWMSAVGLIGLLPILSMFVAHAAQGRSLLAFLRVLPAAVVLGIGVSLSNTIALLAGFVNTGVFARTPKGGAGRAAQTTSYVPRPDWTMWAELALAIYFLGVSVLLGRAGAWLSVAPLLLYGLSYAGVALGQLAVLLKITPGQREARA